MCNHLYTEDGVKKEIGDRVYNYYDMKPGTILRFAGCFPDPWFDVKHDDGTISVLNGQRLCTMEMALRRGFSGAEESVEAVKERIEISK